MQIDLDEDIYEDLARRAEKKGFDSVEEYSVCILETVIQELERSERSESDDVQERLEDLGYLN